MSDDEFYEEETTSQTSKKGDEAFAKAKAGMKKSELDEQLREYINEWRKQRSKEEEELKRLKEKQAKRKEIRAEQEKKLSQQKKEEEEKIRKEEAEQKEAGAAKKASTAGGQAGVTDARKEMSKTKEQLTEEMKLALSIKIKPLDIEGLDSDELKRKAEDLFNIIVQIETDKYDFEQRRVTQDYELKELKERQKVQLRQKALKKGLDPEALTGKHPPKIRMYSKYERRTDTRTYDD